jgi:UDP-2,4-diacetamido-2,4,6-trideoxy-beta-L-altropyranose hydrolase
MDSQVLVVRADANVAMGTGHVMRGLALAQAWRDAGGRVVFATVQSSSAVEQGLRSERGEIFRFNGVPGSPQDASQLAELGRAHHAEWVVVEGYQFDAEYQRSIKDAGLKLLFIDDNGHATHYFADLVLNQNAHAREDLYRSRESQTRLLLGPQYALLRREFQSWRGWKREIASVARKVLVTLGGSDPDNVTALVIRALQLVAIEGLETRVVVGASNPHFESLELAASQSLADISLLKNVTNMPELMAWADVAVSGAGSTCWEMCLLGLPAILIDLAENQRPVAQELDRKQVAIRLSGAGDVFPEEIAGKLRGLLESEEARTAMSARSRELVDGRGAERVVGAIRGAKLRLRRVEEKDCRLLWEWANDPEVRAVSFSSEAISWERHVQWFDTKLTDPTAVLYLATDLKEIPVGQIRCQIEGARAVVSITLAAGSRGQGNGSMALALATEELFRSTSVTEIEAYVKPDNEASLRLFTRAGFRQAAPDMIRGQQAVHFVMQKNGVS